MARKYSKLEPKVPITTMIIGAISVILVFGLIIILTPTAKQKIYANYKNGMGPTLPLITEEHPFQEIKYKNGFLGLKKGLESKINSGDVVFLYISSPTCTQCQTYIGLFEYYFDYEDERVAISAYADKIYYLSPLSDTKSMNHLMEDFEIEQGTPQFIVFYDKKIVAEFTINSSKNEHRNVHDFYKEIVTILEKE